MALTKIPTELSSTPGISDSSTSTAITIDSSGNVTFSGAVTATAATQSAGDNSTKIATTAYVTKFFDDLGKGDAPIEYLVLVEIGLRSFGDDIHAMGSRAMDSKERWFAVDLWRKREAYIAAIRLIREHLSYPQWDCYKLEDYSERQALHKTFVTRHFPLSNGDSNRLEGHLADPANWSVSDAERPCKRAKLEGEVKSKVKVKGNAPAAVPVKPMVWDVENNCFVPF